MIQKNYFGNILGFLFFLSADCCGATVILKLECFGRSRRQYLGYTFLRNMVPIKILLPIAIRTQLLVACRTSRKSQVNTEQAQKKEIQAR
jgi:hypothetical protein